jgi:hypothetical protein
MIERRRWAENLIGVVLNHLFEFRLNSFDRVVTNGALPISAQSFADQTKKQGGTADINLSLENQGKSWVITYIKSCPPEYCKGDLAREIKENSRATAT